MKEIVLSDEDIRIGHEFGNLRRRLINDVVCRGLFHEINGAYPEEVDCYPVVLCDGDVYFGYAKNPYVHFYIKTVQVGDNDFSLNVLVY